MGAMTTLPTPADRYAAEPYPSRDLVIRTEEPATTSTEDE